MESLEAAIKNTISESIEVKQKLLADEKLLEQFRTVIQVILLSYQKGGKLLIAGNGGSAADAQHIAAELVARFYFDRPALPALALTVDTSALTAISNDYNYDRVFSRQLEAMGVTGDVFLGLSTSGNSTNIIEAMKAARERNITTIGMSGSKDGKMQPYCDYLIKVPSEDTPRIQECHITLAHILCECIEAELFGEKK